MSAKSDYNWKNHAPHDKSYDSRGSTKLTSMSEKFTNALQNTPCYDMIGASIQVVILDENITLPVVFLAGQESRAFTAIIWSPKQRQFVGVFPMSDYLKVLLHSHNQRSAFPDGSLEKMTLSEWQTHSQLNGALCHESHQTKLRSTKRVSLKKSLNVSQSGSHYRIYNAACMHAHPSSPNTLTSLPPKSLVIVSIFTTLWECVEAMEKYRIHRLIVVESIPSAEIGDENGVSSSLFAPVESSSYVYTETDSYPLRILAIVTLPQIFEYVGSVLFNIEPGNLLQMINDLDDSIEAISPDDSKEFGEQKATLPRKTLSSMSNQHFDNVEGMASQAIDSRESESFGETNFEGDEFEAIFDLPLKDFPSCGIHLGLTFGVTMEWPLEAVLRLMLVHHLHAVAIVNECGMILSEVRREEIIYMNRRSVYDLNMKVKEGLKLIPSRANGSDVSMICATNTIREVYAHFVTTRAQELYIIDPETSLIVGQLGNKELFKFLCHEIISKKHPPYY